MLMGGRLEDLVDAHFTLGQQATVTHIRIVAGAVLHARRLVKVK